MNERMEHPMDASSIDHGWAPPVTQRERAMIALLEAASADAALPSHARTAAAAAVGDWHEGHRAAVALFACEDDADARLAVIRAGLLHRLAAHAGPDAISLQGLLAIGDSSVPGWLAPLGPALRAATEPAGPRSARPITEQVHEHMDTVVATMKRTTAAVATNLQHVECPATGLQLQLGAPPSWHPVRGWSNGSGPQANMRRPRPDGFRDSVTWQLGVEEWRAYAALTAGLWMADRVALGAARTRLLKQYLLESLGGLLTGKWLPREAVDTFAIRLDAARPPAPSIIRRRRLASLAFSWPAAHAVVVGAIDRYLSGVAAGLPETAPEVGTWVHVWADRDEPAAVAFAPVVAAPPRARGRRRAQRSTREHDADPTVWVRLDGQATEVPLGFVQEATPVAVFG